MPNLKKALAGNEVELISMTEQICNKRLNENDEKEILFSKEDKDNG